MYFHTDSLRDLTWLAAVAEQAVDRGTGLRLNVNERGHLSVKAGGSMWTHPLPGTPDMTRDNSFANVVPEKDYSANMTFVEVVQDLINMDALGSTEGAIRHVYNKVIQQGIDVPEPFTFGKTSEVPRA